MKKTKKQYYWNLFWKIVLLKNRFGKKQRKSIMELKTTLRTSKDTIEMMFMNLYGSTHKYELKSKKKNAPKDQKQKYKTELK